MSAAFLKRLGQSVASQRSLGLALVAVLVLIRYADPILIEELRLKAFDFYQTLQPADPPIRPVVIVDIDEESINTYGQWPWPRSLLAELIDRVREFGGAAVGFDVVFPEPDRSSPSEAVKYFQGLDEATRERISQLPNNDALFAEAIKQARVVLGQSGTLAANTAPAENLPMSGYIVRGPDAKPFLLDFPHLLRNIPPLELAAAGRGLFSIRTERDGMVRRVPVVMLADGDIVPSLTLDMLRVVSGSPVFRITTDEAGIVSVGVPQLELPTDRSGQIWVHFSRHDPSRYVSARDVIAGKVDPQKIAGKLVLLGTSAIGLLDVKTTPLDSAIPGVEIHAQLLEAALTNSLLTSPNYFTFVEIAVAVFAAGLIALLAPAVSALALFALAVATAAVLIGTSWTLFSRHDLLFDVTFPLIAMAAVYVSVVGYGYFREQADRRRIRSAFGQYLSPTLVERLAQSPEQLVLGGEDRVMTVLFSDVRGFTSISEQYKDDPHGLTQLMNRLLTPLTDAIINRTGTIDKYMGDAVMAFWNAPLDDPAHAAHACEAALDMIDRVDALNKEREMEAAAAGRPFLPIKIGVGLNTGRCVVGNMGSNLRFQYTVLGDAVNLASRLEGQTKNYGVPILIGSQTALAAKDYALIEVDSIRVKGKLEPEVVYAVLGRPELAATAAFQETRDLLAGMLRSYRARQWEVALGAIEACRHFAAEFELDELLDLYADRIRQFQVTPPAPDWNGVFVYETK
jgi:adenylate cyclase